PDHLFHLGSRRTGCGADSELPCRGRTVRRKRARAVAAAPRRKRPCRSLARFRSIPLDVACNLHWTFGDEHVLSWVTAMLTARSAIPSPARISRIVALRWQALMAPLSGRYRP